MKGTLTYGVPSHLQSLLKVGARVVVPLGKRKIYTGIAVRLHSTAPQEDIQIKDILDIEDVRPYLSGLRGYDLPLAAAYPLYRWRLLFRQGQYVGVMHADDDLPVLEGDTIVIREPSLDDILTVKEQVESIRPELSREVILYELNDYNTTRFKYDDYEKIFAD